MKYIHLIEMPHRFDEPESIVDGSDPGHVPAAIAFGKFIARMGDRVHATRTPDQQLVTFKIGKERYSVYESDKKSSLCYDDVGEI